MNRRDFLKSSLKTSLLSPLMLLPIKVSKGLDRAIIDDAPKHLGIWCCSPKMFDRLFGSLDKSVVEQVLLSIGAPPDTKILHIYRDAKYGPYANYEIMISQKGLPRVAEGCEIPIVEIAFARIGAFEGWLF